MSAPLPLTALTPWDGANATPSPVLQHTGHAIVTDNTGSFSNDGLIGFLTHRMRFFSIQRENLQNLRKNITWFRSTHSISLHLAPPHPRSRQ